MNRVIIPSYAKKAALEALRKRRELPQSRRYGLEREEAKRIGINSGVERAKQLVRSKTISESDARRIGSFYDRFKNKEGERAEGAIGLWGGRRFGRFLAGRFD